MKVAIVCAAGAFPLALVESLQAKSTSFFLILIKDLAEKTLQNFPHETLKLSNLAVMIDKAKENGCDKICFVGALNRPNPFAMLPDIKTFLMVPQLLKAFKGGDNHLLTSLGKLFEKHNLKLVGAHEIAPQLLAPKGIWGKIHPEKEDNNDCKFGFETAKTLGQFDIGQALVISNAHIVAVEGIEGTDGLLARLKEYRENGRLNWNGKRGILIKALKPNQDNRLDMPAIGVDTVINAAKAGLKGICVEAGNTLVMDIQAVTREADKHGIFIMGG